MAILPSQFYEVASDLYQFQPHSEEKTRTVIGRAYYAAMLAARDHANIVSRGGGVHRLVREHFLHSKQTRIANQLQALCDQREDADYRLDLTIERRQAGLCLKQSEEILAALNTPSKSKKR